MKKLMMSAVCAFGLMASVAQAFGPVSYQCAFVTDPKAYYSHEFTLNPAGAVSETGDLHQLTKQFQLENNVVTMVVQQAGFEGVTLTIRQSAVIEGATVSSMTSTAAEAGQKTVEIITSQFPDSRHSLRISCSLL